MAFLTTLAGGAAAGAAVAYALRLKTEADSATRKRESAEERDAIRCADIIRKAAKHTTPALAFDVASGTAGACHFASADRGETCLALADDGLTAAGLQAGMMVMIQFNADGRTRLFCVPVLRCEGSSLVVMTPTQVADAEARGAYRVNLQPETVSAAVLVGDQIHEGYATDVSMTGLGLHFPSTPPALENDAEIEVRLIYEGTEVQRTARVVRASPPDFGLLLQIEDTPDASKQEQAYRELVCDLSEKVAS